VSTCCRGIICEIPIKLQALGSYYIEQKIKLEARKLERKQLREKRKEK
jgi:hypothetical protein